MALSIVALRRPWRGEKIGSFPPLLSRVTMSADVVQREDVHMLARLARAACPACGSFHAVRSRRRKVADHLLGLLGLRPFRCQSCRWRFHAWPGLRLLLEPARNGAMVQDKSRR